MNHLKVVFSHRSTIQDGFVFQTKATCKNMPEADALFIELRRMYKNRLKKLRTDVIITMTIVSNPNKENEKELVIFKDCPYFAYNHASLNYNYKDEKFFFIPYNI